MSKQSSSYVGGWLPTTSCASRYPWCSQAWMSRKLRLLVLLFFIGSHFTCRDTGHTFLLSYCRNFPKLLHQAQSIKVGPLFGDLATHEAEEIAAGKRHVLSSWGKTLKGPLMCATPGVANRYFIPLSDQILRRELEIGEG